MNIDQNRSKTLVRRSKLFVPVNREKFVAKAWSRNADCIILDLEDAVAPADKDSARRLVKDTLAVVAQGGADVQVRINRGLEEKDLEAIIHPGLTSIMIPKAESAEEIQWIDDRVTELEKERNYPEGRLQFDLIVETATGVVNLESIARSSSRIVQINIGQVDLAVDMGFTRLPENNFDQYIYAENKLRYAAKAAGVQACGLGAQNDIDFTDTALGPEGMRKACRHAYHMGYAGAILIHPAWVEAANECYGPPAEEVALANRVKTALDEAYRRGEGSVAVDGRMYDVANMKQIDNILERHKAVSRFEEYKKRGLDATKSR